MSSIFTRYTKEQKTALCKEWEASGLNQSQYCREQGLNAMTFNGWARKFIANKQTGFIPVSVSAEKVERVPGKALEIKVPGKIIISLPITAEESLIVRIIKEVSKCA